MYVGSCSFIHRLTQNVVFFLPAPGGNEELPVLHPRAVHKRHCPHLHVHGRHLEVKVQHVGS